MLHRPTGITHLATAKEDGDETCGCWAAHELGQLVIDLWRIQNLFLGPPIPEL